MHKKSAMRSVQVELCWQGLESHALISEKKKTDRENKLHLDIIDSFFTSA